MLTEAQDKVTLLDGPSPMQFLPNLTAHLGGPKIFIKRDDEGGPGGGGNKIRKFERQFAVALSKGADTLILAAHSQSNCARELVACAAKHGLSTRIAIKNLVDRSDEDYRNNGNALLLKIMGTRFVDVPNERDFTEAMEEIAKECRAEGLVPYILPFGASDPLGVSGYVESGREIIDQMIAMNGAAPDLIVTATGSCGTQAGLVIATGETDAAISVRGFSVGGPSAGREAEVARLLRETISDDRVLTRPIIVDDRARGAGYGQPTPECIDAIHLLARLEGVFLDPVYTGKAMAGFMDWLPESGLTSQNSVVFVHTGGMPLLFAYAGDFA